MSLRQAGQEAASRFFSSVPQGRIEVHAALDPDALAGAAVLARALAQSGRGLHVRYVAPGDTIPSVEAGVAAIEIGTTAILAQPALDGAPRLMIDEATRASSDLDVPLTIPDSPGLGLGAMYAAQALGATASGVVALAGCASTPASLAHAPTHVADALQREIEAGTVQARPDLLLCEAPLNRSAALAPGPLPEPQTAQVFLEEHRFPFQAYPRELDQATRARLADELVLHALTASSASPPLARMFGTTFAAPSRENAGLHAEYSLVSSACCESQPGAALAYFMGDLETRPELEATQAQHEESLARAAQATTPRPVIGTDRAELVPALARRLWLANEVKKPVLVHAPSPRGPFVCIVGEPGTLKRVVALATSNAAVSSSFYALPNEWRATLETEALSEFVQAFEEHRGIVAEAGPT